MRRPKGDPVLSLILSRALLIAANHKITNPTILKQLKERQ
jgi:hypothetical protein